MALTDAACKNAHPKAKAFKKTDGNGLYLHVMPNGGRYWRLKYRFTGKEKVLALGVVTAHANCCRSRATCIHMESCPHPELVEG